MDTPPDGHVPEKWCVSCNRYRPGHLFKPVRDRRGRLRYYACDLCQQARKDRKK